MGEETFCKKFSTDQKTFFYYRSFASYDVAKRVCEERHHNGRLVVIKDEETFRELVDNAPNGRDSERLDNYFRIGLRKTQETKGRFQWVDGSHFQNEREILIVVLPGDCNDVVIYTAGGDVDRATLLALMCSVPYPFICEMENVRACSPIATEYSERLTNRSSSTNTGASLSSATGKYISTQAGSTSIITQTNQQGFTFDLQSTISAFYLVGGLVAGLTIVLLLFGVVFLINRKRRKSQTDFNNLALQSATGNEATKNSVSNERSGVPLQHKYTYIDVALSDATSARSNRSDARIAYYENLPGSDYENLSTYDQTSRNTTQPQSEYMELSP